MGPRHKGIFPRVVKMYSFTVLPIVWRKTSDKTWNKDSLINIILILAYVTGALFIKLHERRIQKYQRWDDTGSIQKQTPTGIWKIILET